MRALVDYALAKKAVIREFQAGRVDAREICDAHDDLIRAAEYAGDPAGECPVCGALELRVVSYVFSDELPKRENGRTWPRDDIAPLMALAEARLYTVEACPACRWNHLRTQLTLGRSGRRRDREASP